MRNDLFTTVLTSAQDKITVISKASAVFYDLLMTSLQSKDQTIAHSTAWGAGKTCRGCEAKCYLHLMNGEVMRNSDKRNCLSK
jgi:hypothetical protein